MRRVFWKWLEASTERFIKGKEYIESDGKIITELGGSWIPFSMNDSWQRIERDDSTTFEAHGHTWTRHTPGDPMPCFAAGRKLECLWNTGLIEKDGDDPFSPGFSEYPHYWTAGGHEIIGWRFADSAKPEVPLSHISGAVDSAVWPDLSEQIECAEDETPDQFSDFAWLEFLKMAAPDVAAVEDSSLNPSQRRHWNEMEAKQAAREQLKHDAEAKALQERAEQLSDAGRAMDRVNQDHNHKMGWNHGL